MKYMRIYSGPDGESYFEDVELPMNKFGYDSKPSSEGLIKRSNVTKATGISFNEYPPGMDWGGRHTAPRRQFVIIVDGEWEFISSLGVRRVLGAGDILLTEDTTGKGHSSEVIGQKAVKDVVVPVE
jgi:hypothetical protein